MVLKRFTWPAELTLSLIGGKWKGLILHHLLTGESKRFGELKKLSRGISAKILAKHLKELEFDGLITRMVTGTDKPRIVYAPTERSRSLAPVLAAIRQWGQDHLDAYGDAAGAEGTEAPASDAAGGPLPGGSIREPSPGPIREAGRGPERAPARSAAEDGAPGSAAAGTGAGPYGRPVPDIALVS